MRDKWFCINLSISNQLQCLIAVASIYSTGFEDKIFPIHIWKR